MKSLDIHDYSDTNLTDEEALKINDRSLSVYANYLKNSVMNNVDRKAKDDAAAVDELGDSGSNLNRLTLQQDEAPVNLSAIPTRNIKRTSKIAAKTPSTNGKSLTLIGMFSALLVVAAVMFALNAVGYLEFSPDRLSLSETPQMASINFTTTDSIETSLQTTDNDAAISTSTEKTIQDTKTASDAVTTSQVDIEVFKEESNSKLYRENNNAL